MSLLQLQGLSLEVGGHRLLHGVDLTLAAAALTLVIGANGVGKTSLLSTLMGFRKPAGGEIFFCGRRITGWSVERRARAGLGWCPAGRRLFPSLTVGETLDVAAHAPTAERLLRRKAVLALFPDLASRLQERAWRLSGGQQQMLAIGRALMGAPQLLLLDEPTLGLAPGPAEAVLFACRSLTARGTAVLLTHEARPPNMPADAVWRLNGSGNLVEQGS